MIWPLVIWRRLWPFGYAAALLAFAWSGWGTSLLTVRIALTFACGVSLAWFVLWKVERTRRQQAEAQLARGSHMGRPCQICHHYACDGLTCLTCGNDRCSDPDRPTRALKPGSYWLN